MNYSLPARTRFILSVASSTLLLGIAVPGFMKAADDLHLFSEGEVIDADVMNDNFTYLEDQMSSLDDRVREYEDTLSVDASTGSVGIGTTSPVVRLDVRQSSQSPLQGIRAGDSAIGAFLWSDGTSARLSGCSDDNCNVVINGSGLGNVGIGTGSPGYRLTVSVDGSSETRSIAQFRGKQTSRNPRLNIETLNTQSGAMAVGLQTDSDAGVFPYLTLQNGGGNVGIGTTSPAYTLDVNGYVRATNVSVSSDARLKTDIAPIRDALEGIRCLEGVTYRWKNPESSQDLQIGLIAQGVERCYPEIVSTDDQGMKSVAYDRLVAPLIEAVKAQQQALSEQESRIQAQHLRVARREQTHAAQEKKVAELRQRVSALEAQLLETNARMARLEVALTTGKARVSQP